MEHAPGPRLQEQKSYRVTSCLEWQRCLADTYGDMSEDEHAEVERITMPEIFMITNLTEAASYEAAQRSYSIVRNALRLKHSEQEGLWVRDITRTKAHEVLAPNTIISLQQES